MNRKLRPATGRLLALCLLLLALLSIALSTAHVMPAGAQTLPAPPPVPTPPATSTPISTPTPSPVPTATATPLTTPTPVQTPPAQATPAATATAAPTQTATATQTATPAPTATGTPAGSSCEIGVGNVSVSVALCGAGGAGPENSTSSPSAGPSCGGTLIPGTTTLCAGAGGTLGAQECSSLAGQSQSVACQTLPTSPGTQVCNSGLGPTIPIGLSCPAPTPTATPTPAPTPESYPLTIIVTAGDDLPRLPGRDNQPPVGIVVTRDGNQASVTLANNTTEPLDLSQTIVIQTAPDVIATGATATTGTTAVSGSQVVWSNLSLDSGQEASITLDLAATGGGALAAGGGPVIQSVTADGADAQTGEAVAEQATVGSATLSARAAGTYSCQGSSSGSNCQSHLPGAAVAAAPVWTGEALALLRRMAAGLGSLRGLRR